MFPAGGGKKKALHSEMGRHRYSPDKAAIVGLGRVRVRWVMGVNVAVGQCRGWPKVVVHVKHVGQERLGRFLLEVQLLHLVLHHDCLPSDLLSRPGHPEEPRDPLEEEGPHLAKK